MIMALAIEAGHPSLQQFPETPKEPRQGSDTSISKYVDRWSQYLQRMVLTGHHYNDRFFFQQLFRNSHSAFKPIFNELRVTVDNLSHRRPLPPSYYMSSLLTKITQLAHFIDYKVDVCVGAREMQRNMKPSIQQLQIAQMTATSESTGIKCFLCGGPHPLRSCPQMTTIVKDDKAKSALRRILETQQLVLHQLQEDAGQEEEPNDDEVSADMEPREEDYDTPEEAEDKDFCHAG